MRRIGHEALNAQLHTRTVAGSAKEIELMSVASAALFFMRWRMSGREVCEHCAKHAHYAFRMLLLQSKAQSRDEIRPGCA